jgi:hypothetical protein
MLSRNISSIYVTMATVLQILHKLLASFDSHINVNRKSFPYLKSIGQYVNTTASFLQPYKSKIVTNEMKALKVWKLP